MADREAVEIRLGDGRIESVESTGGSHGSGPPEVLVSPGLIDLQVNGLHGSDLNAPGLEVATVRRLVEREWRAGVTGFCPTLVSAPEAELTERLAVLAAARAADPLLRHCLLGTHVEGPFIADADGPRGAHAREVLRDPDPSELERWMTASGGELGIVTLAPERRGAGAFVRALVTRGVVAALGHTAASAGDIAAGVAAGATLSTHLGNGCADMLARHHNPLWPQLADDRLSASFIADGAHLPAPVLKAMARAKGPERTILVSDSIGTTGAPPGRYDTRDGPVDVGEDGVSRPVGSSGFAGGARTLEGCISWAALEAAITWRDALRAATANPARLLGLGGDAAGAPRASIAPGAAADLALFRMEEAGLRSIATIVQGAVVFRSDEAGEAIEEHPAKRRVLSVCNRSRRG